MIDTPLVSLPNANISGSGNSIGKFGLVLLGVSFSIWALIMSAELVNSYFIISQNSSFFVFLIFTSMGCTSLGIIMLNIDLRKMLNRGRLMIRITSLLFALMNAIGLFLIYTVAHGGYGGINLYGPVPFVFYIYVLMEASIYAAYLVVYNSFFVPFLDKGGRKLAFFPNILAIIYGIFLLVHSYYSYLLTTQPQPQVPRIVSELFNTGYSVQMASPLFGLPGLTLGNSGIYLGNIWMDAIIVVANLLFAYLFFSVIFKLERQELNPGTKRELPEIN